MNSAFVDPANNNLQAIQYPLIVCRRNCHSFQSERTALLHVSQAKNPDVIALGEVDTSPVALQNYASYVSPASSPCIAILVARDLTTHIIDLHSQIGHAFIEILSTSPTTPTTFVPNVYSTPRESLASLDLLIQRCHYKSVKTDDVHFGMAPILNLTEAVKMLPGGDKLGGNNKCEDFVET